jgi:hypothetical protein
MNISPDIRPLPLCPHEPPSHLLRIPNSSIILMLPTINFTIYSTATLNYIVSYMESKSSKPPTEPSGNCNINKSSTCSTNLKSPYEVDSIDNSHPWSCNNENQPAEQTLHLMQWTDPDLILKIIDLYK